MPFVEYDPATGQPKQQVQPVQNQPAQNQPAQNQPVDPASYAAAEAQRQMLYAIQHGERPTQGTYEAARQKSYADATEFQRQQALQREREATELQHQQALQQSSSQLEMQRAEVARLQGQFGPRNMSPEEMKDAGNLLAAHGNIMMLYHQNQDIPANHTYRSAYLGEAALEPMRQTDSQVRLFEATRGGSIIPLGRTLLQDTGQVAGKEEAQDIVKQLMPGPGDSPQMAGKKTVDMTQMELNALASKINSYPSNVNTDPLRTQYANSYKDYQALLNTYGTDAQKQYQALSPDKLGAVPVNANQPANQPAVQGGFTASTNDQLNRQASGGSSQKPGFVEYDQGTGMPKNTSYLQGEPTPIWASGGMPGLVPQIGQSAQNQPAAATAQATPAPQQQSQQGQENKQISSNLLDTLFGFSINK